MRLEVAAVTPRVVVTLMRIRWAEERASAPAAGGSELPLPGNRLAHEEDDVIQD